MILVNERVVRSVSTTTVGGSLDEAPSCWRLDRPCSSEIARLVCTHLVQMARGRSGDEWAETVRALISEQILELSGLPESSWAQSTCLKSRKFWLALGALAVLRDQSWLELSPQWAEAAGSVNEERILCENHDDGATLATLYCDPCQLNLCRPCFSVLHLSRRNRTHHTLVRVVGKAESRPGVNVHEGCARLRLPWLLILLDGTTLNGMVEFSGLSLDMGNQNHELGALLAKTCRFCENPTGSELSEVCSHPECQSLLGQACKEMLGCGHVCGGVAGERECLPCLRCGGARQDADDLCVICFTDRLGGAPAVLLSCNHTFHAHCLKATLSRRWSGPRIYFNFMKCPLCQTQIEHPALEELLVPLRALQAEVSRKARLRLEYDQLLDSPAITQPDGLFFGDPGAFALHHYVYVLCHKCGKAYFGGEAQCQEALGSTEYREEELVCGGCSDVAGAQVCPRHGTEFLEYKCRFCCSVAVFFCFGTTHFCAPCHDDFQRLVAIPPCKLAQCPVGPRCEAMEAGAACPLKLTHPPTGQEFALGCGICRNLSSF